jgi:NTE family protein
VAVKSLALVLGGGGALGAFQVGVYQALDEGGFVVDRLAGTSIGAVNAALIAGNPQELRLERLRSFWDTVAEPVAGFARQSGEARRVIKALAALRARLLGRPSLYVPALPRLFLQGPGPGSPSLYNHRPAMRTFRRFINFDRIAMGEPRLAVSLTDLVTGAAAVIDNAETRVGPDHLLASMALLPDFPPVELEGRWFCDGGFSANLPLNAILDPPPEDDLVCVAIDLLGDPGPPVFSLDGMMERSSDLLFSNQSRNQLATLEARFALRSSGGSITLLLLPYSGEGERIGQKIWDYGSRSIAERWRSGHDAGLELVRHLERIVPPPPGRLMVQRISKAYGSGHGG